MSISSIPLSSNVIVKYQAGEKPGGGPDIKQKLMNDVKYDATDQDIYDVAAALFSLSIHPVIQTILRKNYDLVEE